MGFLAKVLWELNERARSAGALSRYSFEASASEDEVPRALPYDLISLICVYLFAVGKPNLVEEQNCPAKKFLRHGDTSYSRV